MFQAKLLLLSLLRSIIQLFEFPLFFDICIMLTGSAFYKQLMGTLSKSWQHVLAFTQRTPSLRFMKHVRARTHALKLFTIFHARSLVCDLVDHIQQ